MTVAKMDIIEAIGESVQYIQRDKKKIDEIKDWMLNKHGISGGRVERILNDYSTLDDSKVDIREVTLFAEQIFAKTGLEIINPMNWYTDNELKEARQYHAPINKVAKLPFQVKAIKISDGVFTTRISTQAITEWIDSDTLYYNPEIQREPTKEIRRGQMRTRPTVSKRNVKEMKELLLKDELMITTLAFNAAPMTSRDGDELLYDEKNDLLTITEGTRLDILDGYHRCLASQSAQTENPDLDFSFNVLITNLTVPEAQKYQAQLAEATPFAKARATELKGERLADRVIQILKSDSELQGRITTKSRLSKAKGDVVTYELLATSIDQQFPMRARVEANITAEYLKKFFDYLIGLNQEEFEYDKESSQSLMNTNKMFAGYVALASNMRKSGLEADSVNDIISTIDFSRENPLWRKIGYLDELGNVSRNAEKVATKYFKEMEVI